MWSLDFFTGTYQVFKSFSHLNPFWPTCWYLPLCSLLIGLLEYLISKREKKRFLSVWHHQIQVLCQETQGSLGFVLKRQQSQTDDQRLPWEKNQSLLSVFHPILAPVLMGLIMCQSSMLFVFVPLFLTVLLPFNASYNSAVLKRTNH